MKKNILILFSFVLLGISNNLIAQKLIDFTISPCKQDCFILADIISQTIRNDTLNIEIGVNQICCGNYSGEIQYNKDTINLISIDKPNKNGLISACDCHCYYVLKYKISNIKSLPKVVLFNNETLEENRHNAGWRIEKGNNEKGNIDSIKISNITKKFFGLYIVLKNKNKRELLSPIFKKDLNGMTTLDFSIYENILKTYSFSDSLIIAEKFRYTKCYENLATIKYEDFLKLDDSTKFTIIDCNLTKLQIFYDKKEKINKCNISKIIINSDNAIVIVKTSDPNDEIQNKVIVSLKKINNNWKIIAIK